MKKIFIATTLIFVSFASTAEVSKFNICLDAATTSTVAYELKKKDSKKFQTEMIIEIMQDDGSIESKFSILAIKVGSKAKSKKEAAEKAFAVCSESDVWKL